MAEKNKIENRSGLLKRRNSFPEIIKKPKIIQVKSLDIPINTSNFTTQKSKVPDYLPPCITTTSYTHHVHQKQQQQQDYIKLTEIDPGSSIHSQELASTPAMMEYCRKCQTKQKLNDVNKKNEFQKIMSIPLLISETKEICSSNTFPENQQIPSLESNEISNFREFKGSNYKDDEIWKIQDIEDISSTSFEPMLTGSTETGEYTESNLDLHVSDVLIKSLRELTECGDFEQAKCKSQFVEFSSPKKLISNEMKNTNFKQREDEDFSLPKESKSQDNEKFEPAHLFLSTELLKKLNIDIVLLNFGSIYSAINDSKERKITRNLNKLERTDSLEVHPSLTTSDSSCPTSDESSNNQKMSDNAKSMLKMKPKPCRIIRNDEKIISDSIQKTKNDFTTSIIPQSEEKECRKSCENIQEMKVSANNKNKIPKETIETKKEKSEKKNNISAHHKSCYRVCPGLMKLHQDHSKIKTHHSFRTPKHRRVVANSSPTRKVHSPSSKGTIKKMMIFQTQSDIITPDNESGPRRFYQKTEINDGGKRIEILEIVECSEKCRTSSSTKPSEMVASQVKKLAISKKNDVCLPEPKIKSKSVSKSYPKMRRRNTTATPTSLYLDNKSVKDESTQTMPTSSEGKHIIFSSKCVQCKHQENISNNFMEDLINANKSPGTPGTIRRRCISSRSSDYLKYHQTFEVIPEEKSSMSTDSSSEEHKKPSKNETIENTSFKHQQQLEKLDNGEVTTLFEKHRVVSSELVSSKLCCSDSMRGSCSCKKQQDFEENETNAQSIDEDGTYQSTETFQSDRSNKCTITSPSTVTANAGSVTPKNVSMTTFPTSSESCNIINPISTTLMEPASLSGTSSSTPITISSNLLIQQVPEYLKQGNNKVLKESEKQNIENSNIYDKKLPFKTKTDYIWRVDDSGSDDNKKPCPISLYQSPISTSSICFSGKSFGRNFQCFRCCFCNPSLHECSEYTNYTDSTNCVYCNRKKTPKLEEAETNTECELFCRRNNCPIPCHYPRTSSTDQTKYTQTELSTKICDTKNAKNLKDSKTRKSFRLQCKDKCSQKYVKQNKKLNENSENKLPKMKCSSSYIPTSKTLGSTSSSSVTEIESISSSTSHDKVDQEKKDTRDIGIQKTPTPEKSENDNNCRKSSEMKTNSGWSVTVTGLCQDLVPDVEMKLKFSKGDSQLKNQNKLLETVSKNENTIGNSPRMDHSLLPLAKKSLPKTVSDTDYSSLSPSYSRRQLIPSESLRHSEKHTNFSTKNPRGQRTTSYHIISAHSGIINHGRNYHSSNDHLLDEFNDNDGNLNLLRNNRIPIVSRSLAITGNAIEREQKPRVATMSEKDVTRKYRDLTFTRNKPFL